ncbi:MAG: aldose epimerase family protein [Enterococcus lemanii]|jgi:aldose 1-epimerase
MPKVRSEERKNVGTVYTLYNENQVEVSVIADGARLYEWIVLVDGQPRDLVVGYESLVDHQKARYYGATIGPVAGRIAGAQFELDGKIYHSEANEQGNTLHGGSTGYDTKKWQVKTFQNEIEAGVVFSLEVADGTGGFPGNIQVEVTYALNEENTLRLSYFAKTDQKTLFNLTNHGYFNLTGQASEPIDFHYLQVNAKEVAQTNADVTTNGKTLPVMDTKFDFLKAKQIGTTLLDDPFLLHHEQKEDLVLVSPDQKVRLSVATTAPAVVLYTTGENEANTQMKTGRLTNHGSLAIETQAVPGTEKYAQFGDIVLRPNEPYRQETTYQVHF